MAKSGNSVFRPQHRSTDVFGALVRLVPTGSGLAVTRRDTPLVLRHGLGVGDRQARASMSSYQLEGWTEPNSGINSPFAEISSLSERVRVHRAQVYESRVSNGRLGGRPRLDAAPGSTSLMSGQHVETVVQTAPQGEGRVLWQLA